MTQLEVYRGESIPANMGQAAGYDRAERRLRRISAWFMLFFLFQGQLGATWDREWHAYIGRDWFWTPPHILIYSCVTGAGLITLGVVLTDTVRYWKGRPGVDSRSTISVFRFFHAPLGFIVTGFGALLSLVAAPLDNYWHQLYGIDIALWAPFHMMGITGAFIGTLGMAYVFSSEAAIARQQQKTGRKFLGIPLLEWGALMSLAGLLNLTLIGFLQFPLVAVGVLRITTYPLPAVACAALCLFGAVRLTAKPGAALLIVLLLFLYTMATELFVPWAIRTAVAAQGLLYRVPGRIPFFRWSDALLPLAFLLSALLIDGIAWMRWRQGKALHGQIRGTWLPGLIITVPEMVIAPMIINWNANIAQSFLAGPGSVIPLDMKLFAASLAVPVILLAGVLGAIWGADFGDIWHLNSR
ncbi:MAG: hypothetical protein JO011_11105 [Ktedonobacteraceae bacterium]|nr:hypothetical protein [Ktedonobacteraceae bacterium]